MNSLLKPASVCRRSVGVLLLAAAIVAVTNGHAIATSTWGEATPAAFASGVQNADSGASFNSVSCASVGNCVAVGRFKNATGGFEAFTMSMVSGVWGDATPAVFASGVQNAARSATFRSVSCASVGNCVAAGDFRNATAGVEVFTMSMVSGVWGQAVPAVFASGVQHSSPNSNVYSVSCASVGNCVAAGRFKKATAGYEAFTMSMVSGVWGQAVPAVFASGVQHTTPNSLFNSVSCGSAGNCVAAGQFKNATAGYEAFTMTSTAGVWGQATPAVFASGVQNTNPSDNLNSVSCGSAGNCVAAGQFTNATTGSEAFTMSMVSGVWGQAVPAVFASGVQNTNPNDYFNSVSCASAGNCTAVGRFRNAAGNNEAFTMTSTAGAWGQATPAVFASGVQNTTPGDYFSSVSCGSAGNCVAAGRFKNATAGFEAFAMSMVSGVWGEAVPAVFASGVQNATSYDDFSSVSCGSVGNCVAAGMFKNAAGWYEAFTMTAVDNTTSSTTTTTAVAPTTTVAAATTVAPTTTVAAATTVAPTTTVAAATTVAPTTTIAATTTVPLTGSVVLRLPVAKTPLVVGDSLLAGTEVTATAGGFAAGEYVQLILASTPRVIASGYANAQGVVTLRGSIPANFASGRHTLAVLAPATGTGFKQTVTISDVPLPATGSEVDGLFVVALLAVVVGLVILLRRRRPIS